MLNSSSSTLPPIKAQHRIAKKRPIRRRRIDLNCGCSIFIHINCANNGFTHRGEHHCTSGREFRFYLGGSKSPIFQDTSRGGPVVHQNQDIPHRSPVQPQPTSSISSPQGIPPFPSLDDFDESFWDDIFK
uniref:Transcriptional activator protein n=1 Tax=Pepper golden mosaic virus TaxID=223301 RepID=A0A0F7YM09_9GEMI|nr:Transcriptional activator protein [Pepper golden mosaic virus]